MDFENLVFLKHNSKSHIKYEILLPRIPKIPYLGWVKTKKTEFAMSEFKNNEIERLNENEDFKKQCNGCTTWLPLNCFYKNKSKKFGRQDKCIDCIKEYKFSKKLISKETLLPLPKDFFFIPDIYIVGYGRTQIYQHCCLHCEQAFFCLKKVRDFEDLYCDHCNLKQLQIPEKNKSQVNFVGNVVGWLNKLENINVKRTRRNYKKVYQRDQFTCQYCGYNLQNSTEFHPLHIDHIKPWSASGGNSMNNLVVSCQPCNLLISDKWFESFEEKKEWLLFERKKTRIKTWKM